MLGSSPLRIVLLIATLLLPSRFVKAETTDIVSRDGQLTLHLPTDWQPTAAPPTTNPSKTPADFHAVNAAEEATLSGRVTPRGADPKVALDEHRKSVVGHPGTSAPTDVVEATVNGKRVFYFSVEHPDRGALHRSLFTLTETPTHWTWLLLSIPAAKFEADKAKLLSIATTSTELAKAQITLASADGRYQVKVPGEWKDVTSKHPGSVLVAENDVVYEGVTVKVAVKTPKEKVDLKTTAQNSAKAIAANLTDAKTGVFQAMQLNGRPTIQTTVTGTTRNSPCGYLITVMETKDEVLFVTGYAPLAGFDDRIKELREIARDFRELPASAANRPTR